MDAEEWERLRAAYDRVMDAAAEDRTRLLAELAETDSALARELGQILASTEGDTFLATPLTWLAPAARLSPGTVLCGRFTLLRAIGEGGMGEVWAARDDKLKEDVAIKMVRRDATDAHGLRRFTREIQLARRISHPNVCRVYELFEDTASQPSRTFLTMELLEGETLAARLLRLGPLPAVEALAVFRQVAAGLGAAHDAGVIHRDLKPGNIMLVGGASGRRAVIMDFGLARDPVRSEPDHMTQSGMLVGTPEYMAPEQVSSGPLSAATDIYALGLILFEMLRGKRPFAGTSTFDSWMRRAREGPERLSGVVPGVQARIDTVIARSLEYQPGRRYQSVTALLTALDESVYIAVPRSRRFWVAASVATAALVAAAGIAVWSGTRPDVPSNETLAWYEDAHEALAEGAPVRALNNISRAIELAPGFAPSHAALAEIRLELDMPGAAQASMLRANELAQDRRRLPAQYVRYMDGIQALLQRDCAKAVDSLKQVSAAADPAARPLWMVTTARVLARCDRPDEAQRLLADAAAVDPRNAAVPLRMARLAASRREYAAAYASLDSAEQLFRDRNNLEGVGEVLTLRGTYEVAQDRLQEADVTLKNAEQLAGSVGDVRQTIRTLLQQAILQRKRGDVVAAAQLTTSATDLARRNNLESLTIEGLLGAANVHMIRNQFDDARTLFERALTVAEANRHEDFKARVHLSLASVYVATLQADAAAAEIRASRPYYESINQTRNLALLDALSGEVRLMLLQYETAIEEFRHAIERAVEIADVEQELSGRQLLADALAGSGLYPEALAEHRQVRQMHDSAGRVRGATFAALNVVDLLTRLGQFEAAAAEKVPEIDAAARELRAQQKLIEASVAVRAGRYQAAGVAAGESIELNANLSPWRLARAQLVRCVATARMAGNDAADETCTAAERATRDTSDLPLRLESRLALAEAHLARRQVARAAALVEEAGRILGPLPLSEDRWRFLALAAAVAAGPEQAAARERLTREVDQLRLKWGEANFKSWQRRADVAGLLNPKPGGM